MVKTILLNLIDTNTILMIELVSLNKEHFFKNIVWKN